MNTKRHYDVAGSTVLTLMMLSWSASPLLIRQFKQDGLTVWDMNFWRYLVVFILSWLVVWHKYLRPGRPYHGQLTRRIWFSALNPAIPFLICQITLPLAIYHLEPGLASILHKQYIIWSVMISMVLFAEERRLLRSGQFWVGIICAIAGSLGVAAFQPEGRFGGDVWGIVLIVVAAVTWAWYGVSIKTFTREIHSTVGLAVVATYLFIGLGVLMPFWGQPEKIASWPAHVWLLMCLSGGVNIYLPHIGFYWVVPRLGVTIPQTVVLLTAFITAFFSWLIFSEHLSPLQWCSGVVLIFGALLTLLAQRHYLHD